MVVLSLFDGVSCGRLALERAGVPIMKYYASEVDTTAIGVAKTHYPDTVYLGDVRSVTQATLPPPSKVDLLIGGSPCQGFSIAGNQLNFDDPRSVLFFEFVRVLHDVKPTYFLLENVPMALGVKNAISEALGVEPVLVNSSKFSAQGRKRLYWTNIPVQALPLFDHPSCLADVLEPVDAVPSDLWLPHDRVVTMLDAEVVKRKIGFVAGGGQGSRIYSVYGKSVTVTAMEGRPDMYAMPCITPERLTKNQHGPRFRPDGGKAFTLTVQDSHGVLVPHGVRCLTPVECERLQTLPDNWTALCDGVPLSPKKRTRLVGNGWTVDVLAHIFKSLIS